MCVRIYVCESGGEREGEEEQGRWGETSGGDGTRESLILCIECSPSRPLRRRSGVGFLGWKMWSRGGRREREPNRKLLLQRKERGEMVFHLGEYFSSMQRWAGKEGGGR